MKELGQLAARHVETPEALTTITDVELDQKCKHAKVWISIIPSSCEDAALKTFEEARGELQARLFKKLKMKSPPKIKFELDHGNKRAARVEKIFLKEQDK